MIMQDKKEALAIDTQSWLLRLRTTADPEAQLSDLARLLGRPKDHPSLAASVEVRAPCWVPDAVARWPSVFENSIYALSVRPKKGWIIRSVRHPVFSSIEDSLDVEDGTWRGTIKTGNDIGWFPLEIAVQDESTLELRTDSVAWQVWPLKLDYANDLKAVTSTIESEYPLWIFSFGSMTENDAGRSSGRNDRFLLLWFAQFRKVWEGLEKGLSIVIENPHMAIVQETSSVRLDRLKGRLNHRLEEKIAEDGIQTGHRYDTDIWHSSLDTPENRFVLHVLNECLIGLQRFRTAIDRPGISASFLARLNGWIRSMATIKANPMFRGVGSFTGMSQESLVLYNRTGYSAVYRAWLELRRCLEFFAHAASSRLGMRSINELYEIWCFLEVRNILVNLGLVLKEKKSPRWRTNGVQRDIDNSSAFRFEGANGVRLSLSHEPVFSRSGDRKLVSFTVSQRPDIVLEAHWPAAVETPERRLLWIFDAKYRLKVKQPEDLWNRDEGMGRVSEYLVPPDAIDQMHRYRDSIYLISEDEKSRPVISALALYPGLFDQTAALSNNPYYSAISEVGIGAFPLVPGENGSIWLQEYLEDALELRNPAAVTDRTSVKIPVSGLKYSEDDVLIVYLSSDRDREYLNKFSDGYAEHYHIYVRGGPSPSRLERVHYLAVIDIPRSDGPYRMIRGVYLIRETQRRKRGNIDPSASGTSKPRDSMADCHLLLIGNYLQLPQPLAVARGGGHWFRYTSLTKLFEAKNFSDLCTVRE